MDIILKKAIPVICIALAAPLVLSSCSRATSSSDAAAPASSMAQEQASSAETVPYVCVDSATGDYHG